MTCIEIECPLHGSKDVAYMGSDTATILLVGESPGKVEVITGKPFQGPSGDLLIQGLSGAGIKLQDCYVANAAKCQINKDQLKEKELNSALSHCRPYLISLIQSMKPRVIVALGDIAMRQLLKRRGIKKHHGEFHISEFGIPVYTVFHPAFVLRDQNYLQTFRLDFEKLKRALDEDVFDTASAPYGICTDLTSIGRPTSLALDTETQALDWMSSECSILSVSLAWDTYSVQVPLFEKSEDVTERSVVVYQKKKEPRRVYIKEAENFRSNLAVLHSFLEDEGIKKYMFNGNYDLHWLCRTFRDAGMPAPVVRGYVMDVQSALHVYNENTFDRASLEEAQKSFTTYDVQYSQNFSDKYDKAAMVDVTMEDMVGYACPDAIVTYQAGQNLKNALIGLRIVDAFAYNGTSNSVALSLENPPPSSSRGIINYFANLVMPVIRDGLFTLEENGVLVDIDRLPIVKRDLSLMIAGEIDKAVSCIPKKVKDLHDGKPLKLSRTALIRDTLFSKEGYHCKVPVGNKAKAAKKKTDDPSVNKDTRVYLKSSESTPVGARNFIAHYEQWSELNTLLTRYIKGFETYTREDGRIHCSYSLCNVATGRSSSANPNMQNNPKRSKSAKIIRKLLVAPPKHVLIEVDASQAEIRWMGHCAGDPTIIQVYRTGGDIHSMTAEALSGKKKADMPESEWANVRRNAKGVVFGYLYGMGAQSFQSYAKVEYGLDLTMEQAQDYRSRFFARYNQVGKYHQDVERFLRRYGYITSPFGRVRRLPEVFSLDQFMQFRAIRQAINFTIQSASSDTVLLALTELLAKGCLGVAKPVAFIHDSLVFECPDDPDTIAQTISVIKQEMENPPLHKFGIELTVPLVSDAQVGYDMSAMMDVDKFMERHNAL